MGTSSGCSLNLAAVYKPAGGGGRGHCGRQGSAPPAGPARAAGPAPARLLATASTRAAQQQRDAQGSPGRPVGSRLRGTRRTWSGGGIRDPGLGTPGGALGPGPPGNPGGWGGWRPQDSYWVRRRGPFFCVGPPSPIHGCAPHRIKGLARNVKSLRRSPSRQPYRAGKLRPRVTA